MSKPKKPTGAWLKKEMERNGEVKGFLDIRKLEAAEVNWKNILKTESGYRSSIYNPRIHETLLLRSKLPSELSTVPAEHRRSGDDLELTDYLIEHYGNKQYDRIIGSKELSVGDRVKFYGGVIGRITEIRSNGTIHLHDETNNKPDFWYYGEYFGDKKPNEDWHIVEILEKAAPEFDVNGDWVLNAEDIDCHAVVEWLAANSSLKWMSGRSLLSRDRGTWVRRGISNRRNGLYNCPPLKEGLSTPEALTFFKTVLSGDAPKPVKQPINSVLGELVIGGTIVLRDGSEHAVLSFTDNDGELAIITEKPRPTFGNETAVKLYHNIDGTICGFEEVENAGDIVKIKK